VKLQIDSLEARLRAPFVFRSGAVTARALLLVRLEDADGHVGFGEAGPLPEYDGVRIEDVRAALEDCRAAVADADGADREQVLAACARAAVLPQAVASIDLALWDLAGRRAQRPVWQLLGAAAGAAVEVNATIAAPDRAGAADAAGAARAAGYRAVKVKVAIGDDAGRLAAVRAAVGPQTAIRLDANGAWSVDEAIASLRALEPVEIELCEEPVAGLDAMADVWPQTRVAISIDETAAAPGALDQRVCDGVCVKIARCGGISGVIEAARRARIAGYEVYLASTLDGPLGVAAALHAAAAIAPERPCGLATLGLFVGRGDPLPVVDGRIALPAEPGLGDGLLSWYEGSVSR